MQTPARAPTSAQGNSAREPFGRTESHAVNSCPQRRLRWEDANEADAWRLTTAIILTAPVREQGPLFAASRFPFWFLAAAGLIKAA